MKASDKPGEGGKPAGNPPEGAPKPKAKGGVGDENRGGVGEPEGSLPKSGVDDSKPLPRSESPDQYDPAGQVAPQQAAQTDLVLRKIRDLLDKGEMPKDLVEKSGMSRDEIEQFVRKFEKAKDEARPRDGKEVEIKPGKGRDVVPGSQLPDLDPNARVGARTDRKANSLPQDNIRDNIQGLRSTAPPELRGGFERYTSNLTRGRKPAPVSPAPNPTPPVKPSGTGSGGVR